MKAVIKLVECDEVAFENPVSQKKTLGSRRREIVMMMMCAFKLGLQ